VVPLHTQAIQAQQHQELIVVASEMKACVRRGLTLVHVYGEFSMTWKMVTQLFRSAAYEKFDKVRGWVWVLVWVCTASSV